MVIFDIAEQGRGPSIEEIVKGMAKDLPQGTGYGLFSDNLFTKPTLHKFLRDELHINACGTWRRNYGMPDALRPDRRRGDLEKGEYDWRVSSDGLVGIVWHDSVLCNFLTTYHAAEDVVTVPRRERGQVERVDRRCPRAAADYNKHMGAVDRFDSLRASYTTHHADAAAGIRPSSPGFSILLLSRA